MHGADHLRLRHRVHVVVEAIDQTIDGSGSADPLEHRAGEVAIGHFYRATLRRPKLRASFWSTGRTASISRAAAASTDSPAVSTTAVARAYSGSRLSRMLRNS